MWQVKVILQRHRDVRFILKIIIKHIQDVLKEY